MNRIIWRRDMKSRLIFLNSMAKNRNSDAYISAKNSYKTLKKQYRKTIVDAKL